eukprot:858414-Pyramimonas_sp.AAC.1
MSGTLAFGALSDAFQTLREFSTSSCATATESHAIVLPSLTTTGNGIAVTFATLRRALPPRADASTHKSAHC